MLKYNLNEGMNRVGIPDEMRSRVKYIQLPLPKWMKKLSGGQVRGDTFYVVTNGDKLRTDFILVHEVLGHGMDPALHDSTRVEYEHRATQVTLEKFLELAIRYPEDGYGEYFDEYISKIEKRRDFNSLQKILHPYDTLIAHYYTNNIDTQKLKQQKRKPN